MVRTQTMVQLTADLVEELDREAQRTGDSRSAVIRAAIASYLAEREHVTKINRYTEGYKNHPPATPDEWGDVAAEADQHGHELAQRLDKEDMDAGLQW